MPDFMTANGKLDLLHFTQTLAKGFDDALYVEGNDGFGDVARIEFPGKFHLKVGRCYGKGNEDKVEIHIFASDIPPTTQFYGQEYKLPQPIKISTSRHLAHVRKDIGRRLIEPAKAPLAARRAYVAKENNYKKAMRDAADNFRTAFPELDVRQPHDGKALIFKRTERGPSLSAELYADNTLRLSLGVVTVEQFRQISKILYGE